METIFITGGYCGIGLGLAQAYLARGATVIIGGRNGEALECAARENKGLHTVMVDVSRADSVQRCAEELKQRFPALNMLINNAGVQRVNDFVSDTAIDTAWVDVEIDTNLKGIIFVTAALLPLLKRQESARIVNVSSGLAFVPRINIPVYCATKAAVHSFTLSLREQLRGNNIRVIELIPPLVETQLHRFHPPITGHRAMALPDFVAQSMKALDSHNDELPIGLAKVLLIAARVAPKLFLRLINK